MECLLHHHAVNFDFQAATTFNPPFVDVVDLGWEFLSATTTLHSIVSWFIHAKNRASVYLRPDCEPLVTDWSAVHVIAFTN